VQSGNRANRADFRDLHGLHGSGSSIQTKQSGNTSVVRLILPPRCLDTHGTPEVVARTGLQLLVDRMMHDHRLRLFGLCCVPIRFGAIKPRFKRRFELKVLRPLKEMIAPVFIAKANQPGFFGKTTFSALTTS
jgi:hypothetical protein